MALERYICIHTVCTHTQTSTLLISCTSLQIRIEENNRFLPICLSMQDLTLTKLKAFLTRTKVKLGKPFHCQSCHFSAVGTLQISSWFCAWLDLKKSLNPEHSTKPTVSMLKKSPQLIFFLHTHKLPPVSITKLPEGAVQELSPCQHSSSALIYVTWATLIFYPVVSSNLLAVITLVLVLLIFLFGLFKWKTLLTKQNISNAP